MTIPFIKVSTTERQGFKSCRRAWDLGSYGRRNLEANKIAPALWFGTGIHETLDAFYGKGTNPLEFWQAWTSNEFARMQSEKLVNTTEELTKMEELRGLGMAMLQGYVEFAKGDDFRVLMTEQQFEVPIRSPETGEAVGLLVGRFDGICQTADGELWLLEHKTAAEPVGDISMTDYGDQITGYCWAAQQVFGRPLAGVYFNVLLKRAPMYPIVLKDGKRLSKDKGQPTTYALYLEAIQKHGFKVEDYADILDYLRDRKSEYFLREKYHLSQHTLAQWGRQLYLEYLDMADNPRIYPTFSWTCNRWCDYVHICRAMQNGDDWEFVARTLYHVRPLPGDTYEPLTPADAKKLRGEYNTRGDSREQ